MTARGPGAVAALLAAALLAAAAYAQAAGGGALYLVSFTAKDTGGGPLQPGDEAVLTLVIGYRGEGPLEELEANLSLPGELGGAALTKRLKLTAWPGSSIGVSFRAPLGEDAPVGNYTVKATVAARDASGRLYEASFNLTLTVHPPLEGVSASAELEHPYPGARGTTLKVTVENAGTVDIENVTVSFNLSGWRPEEVNVSLGSIPSGSSSAAEVSDVYVPMWLKPGSYTVTATVEAIASVDGEVKSYRWRQKLGLELSPLPELHLNLVDVQWGGTCVSPGSVDVPLTLTFQSMEPAALSNIEVRLLLPEGFSVDGRRAASAQADIDVVEYGGFFTMSFSLDVNASEPGVYPLNLKVQALESSNGVTIPHVYSATLQLPVCPSSTWAPLLERAEWVDGRAYPGEQGATLRLVLRGADEGTISGIRLELHLPPGFTSSTGAPRAWLEVEGGLTGYGDTLEVLAELNIGDKVEPGTYYANLTLHAILERGGSRVPVQASYVLPLTVSRAPSSPFRVVDTSWLSWVVGDESYSATALVRLLYLGEDTLRSLIVNATVTSGGSIRGNATYVVVVQEGLGAQAYDVLEVQVPNIAVNPRADAVELKLHVTAVRETPSGGTYESSQELSVRLPARREKPLAVAGVYTEPAHLLPGARSANVNLHLLNTAPSPVRVVSASVSASYLQVLDVGGSCVEAQVQPGDTCVLTLTVDVDEDVEPGVHSLPIRVAYSYVGGEQTILGAEVLTVSLIVEDVGQHAPSITVRRAYWALTPDGEPLDAYPGSKATLQLEVYNAGPTPAFGVKALLKPVGGWASIEEQPGVCEQLQPGDSCTLTAVLSVGNSTQPGLHALEVQLTYLFRSYNLNKEISQTTTIEVEVSDPAEAVSVLLVSWAKAPTPGSASNVLRVAVYRDPSRASSIEYVELVLPPGLKDPSDGDTVVVALAAGQTAAAQYGAGAGGLERLLQPLQQLQVPSTVELFAARVYAEQATLERQEMLARIVWVDRFGTVLSTIQPVILVPGYSPPQIVVSAPPRILMEEGEAELVLSLNNPGPSPVRNVYVILVPSRVTVALPNRAVEYVPYIEAGGSANVTFTLRLVPGAEASTQTFSIGVSVLYEDVFGTLQSFNTSVSLLLVPRYNVEVRGVKATWTNGTLKVSGSLVNLGTQSVESAVVEILVGGKVVAETFLGTVDPSSEYPFYVEAQLTGKPNTIEIRALYRDAYGVKYSTSTTVTVSEEPSAASAVSMESSAEVGGVPTFAKAVIATSAASVAVALAYMLKRRRRRGES
ncbi:MAG: NEW3 domain-containing protein [Thermoproteota archaeon]